MGFFLEVMITNGSYLSLYFKLSRLTEEPEDIRGIVSLVSDRWHDMSLYKRLCVLMTQPWLLYRISNQAQTLNCLLCIGALFYKE